MAVSIENNVAHPNAQAGAGGRGFMRKPMVQVLAWALLGAAVWQAPLPVQAQLLAQAAAQDAEVEVSLKVSAGSLDEALSEFGRQAGVQIVVNAEVTAGLSSPGVSGRMTVASGLHRLLAGTGLQAVQGARGGYTLRKATGVTALEAVTVTAAWNAATEGTGSYTAAGPSSTATGLNLSLRETPQSVTVMTRQRMDDFNLKTLTDVLEQTPGLTVDRQGDGNNFMVRGNAVNLQVDGQRQMASGWYANTQMLYTMDDMAEMDRIEVLKGSSGLMSGDGKYGATVNMIRKRPTQEFQASVGVNAGSWDSYRSDVDLSGPLNRSGTVRGRLVAAAADSRDFRDYVKRSNQTLYGTLDIDLTSQTLLNLGVTYRHRKYYGAGSTSMIQAYAASGEYLGLQPRSFNVGAPWSGYEQDTVTVFASLEHRFNNDWTAKLRVSDEKTKMPEGETGIWFTGVPEVVDVNWARNHTNINRSVAIDVRGPFQLFGRTHELLLGADMANTSSNTYSANKRFTNQGLDYSEGGGAIVRPDDLDTYPMDNHSYFSSKRSSFYAASRFSLADPVSVIAGARVTNYRQYDKTPYSYSNFDFEQNGVITPYLGIVADVSENISVYGSYASIFKPQSAIDAQGKSLDPEEGLTYEVGAKGEFFNGSLNASLAYFWMRTDNVAESTGAIMPDGTAIYRAVTGAMKRGYELELSGELAPGWQVQGGYVMNSSNLDSASYMPKTQFKLATSYRIAGIGDGLTLGAAARWQSRTTAGKLEQDSFWVVDLMARYQLNRHLNIGVNINNVFDKKYFSGMRDFGRVQYTWGAPRSFNLGMRYQF